MDTKTWICDLMGESEYSPMPQNQLISLIKIPPSGDDTFVGLYMQEEEKKVIPTFVQRHKGGYNGGKSYKCSKYSNTKKLDINIPNPMTTKTFILVIRIASDFVVIYNHDSVNNPKDEYMVWQQHPMSYASYRKTGMFYYWTGVKYSNIPIHEKKDLLFDTRGQQELETIFDTKTIPEKEEEKVEGGVQVDGSSDPIKPTKPLSIVEKLRARFEKPKTKIKTLAQSMNPFAKTSPQTVKIEALPSKSLGVYDQQDW
jgi:hypothetical protein